MALKSSEVSSIFGILREAFRIYHKNGKLMIFITVLIQLTFSFLALANIYALQPFISGLFTKVLQLRHRDTRSFKHFESSLRVEKEIILITAVELIFLIAYSTALLCSVVATTYLAASSYRKKDFNFKELFWKIQRTCAKPMISWFFVAQLGVGYTVQVLALLSIFLVLTNGSLVFALLGFALIFLSLFFNLYVAGVWMIGLVNSVLENIYEVPTKGEEDDLIGGRMVRGSAINLFFMLITIIIFLCSKLRGSSKEILAPGLVTVLVVVNMICLVKIFSFTAYTVFYFRCKKIYGDEEVGVKTGNCKVLNGSSC
ncbi:uncharacterized protein LOC122646392 [Telopea speciosissima]|uniref:uncharacterized protein LOC122646392 n=1 Tax=Telopea speciosissima TaxID=54955 RepID=UPI001CC3B8EB|nr:uncharacterized protein LOC122646392 [Telopea speciosissima]